MGRRSTLSQMEAQVTDQTFARAAAEIIAMARRSEAVIAQLSARIARMEARHG